MNLRSRFMTVLIGTLAVIAAITMFTACPPPTDPGGGDDPTSVTTVVSGTITDSITALPIEGVLATSGVLFASSNAAGEYALTVEHDGEFQLDLSKADYVSVTEAITTEAATLDRDFSLVYAGAETTVSGSVYFPDTEIPIDGAAVSVGTHTDTTDAAGTFSIGGVPLGSYDFAVTKSGFTTHVDTVDVLAPLQIDVELVGGPVHALTGTVTNSIAADVSGVSVVLLNPGGLASDILATTDGSGDYTLVNVPDGSRTVKFSATYYAVTDEAVTASDGATHNVVLDADPIGPPTLVAASASGSLARTISVMWTATPADTFAGVNVYRSTSAGGTYTKVNAGVETVAPYVDSFTGYGTYYYKLTALNIDDEESALTTNNESADSAVLEVISSAVMGGTNKLFLDNFWGDGGTQLLLYVHYDSLTPANNRVYIGNPTLAGTFLDGPLATDTPVGVAGSEGWYTDTDGIYVLGSDGTVYWHPMTADIGSPVVQSFSAPCANPRGLASEMRYRDLWYVTTNLYFLAPSENKIYNYSTYDSILEATYDFSPANLPAGDIDYHAGKILLAESGTNTIHILDLATETVEGTLPMPGVVAGMGWDGSPGEVYVATPGSQTVTLYRY